MLKLIENNSVKKYESYNDFGDNLLNEFKEKSDDLEDYGTLVNKFVNKLSIVLNKENNKNFIEEFQNKLLNLGNFNNNRIKNVKDLYNNYFRYYLSFVSNNYDKKCNIKELTIGDKKIQEDFQIKECIIGHNLMNILNIINYFQS